MKSGNFWSKVSITIDPNECWLWQGGKNAQGYGTVKIKGKMYRAHRVAYELVNGPIPNGMVICHQCDTPSCVNPQHLFLGTDKDNVRDTIEKGRWVSASQPGESNHSAKLTEPQVIEIRRLYTSKERTQADLAKQYGVTRQLIGLIIARKLWTHVP